MWIFTRTGFVSAVQDWNDPRMVLVRARDAESLSSLSQATGTTITPTPTADYPYRVHITKIGFADWVRAEAESLDYPNFKSEVAHTRGEQYAHALMNVWSTMHDVEDPTARISQAAPTRGGVPSWVLERIQRPLPDDCHVVSGATPIVYFGDPERAEIATVGINPAPNAFTSSLLGTGGELVTSPLLDRRAAEVREGEPPSDGVALRIAEACRSYFDKGIPHRWFVPFEHDILPAVKASYVLPPDRTSLRERWACHLDLVQWPTATGWSKVPASVRDSLVTEDAWFLRRQLQEGDFKAILLDGRSTTDTVTASLGTKLDCDQVVPAHDKASLKMYSGYLGATLVLGWNIPLARPITDQGRTLLADWVRDRFDIG